ncbi:YdhK family protein [Bacillus sp. SCS-153A]|uniref:YdhK family protein n=1 Tax=Rossellomorea sedimentorum TaxID=3115294 RepID=UPI003905A81B
MKKIIWLFAALLIVTLAACSIDNQPGNSGSGTESGKSSEEDHGAHGEGEHKGSGEVPEEMKEAKNPKYQAGSTVIIEKGHLPGMEGAEATVAAAYDTTVYRVSYNPVTGGDRVEQHEWVVHEELKDADKKSFKPGDEVTIEAEHMEGMQGAKAVVDTAEQMTVYVIDFTPLDGSEKVENHLWVTEDELSPVD